TRFSRDWSSDVCSSDLLFKLFLAIVIVSMMSNEYSNKTIKQNLIDGLSKKEFILSKVLTVISLALISTVFVFVVSLVLGLVYSDYNELSIILDRKSTRLNSSHVNISY